MKEQNERKFEERNQEAEKNLKEILKKISPYVKKNVIVNNSTVGKWYVNPDSVSVITNTNSNLISNKK
jgi:hypothetical protein